MTVPALALLVGVGCRLSPPRLVAMVLVKTEGLAIVAGIIFPEASGAEQAQLILPAVLYHSVQMLTSALTVPVLGRQGAAPICAASCEAARS